MTTATVYHHQHPTPHPSPTAWPHHYQLAATVEACTDPDMANRLTQHAWTDWRDNPGVLVHVPTPRSTQVGDVVRLNGQAWRCNLLGRTALHG